MFFFFFSVLFLFFFWYREHAPTTGSLAPATLLLHLQTRIGIFHHHFNSTTSYTPKGFCRSAHRAALAKKEKDARRQTRQKDQQVRKLLGLLDVALSIGVDDLALGVAPGRLADLANLLEASALEATEVARVAGALEATKGARVAGALEATEGVVAEATVAAAHGVAEAAVAAVAAGQEVAAEA